MSVSTNLKTILAFRHGETDWNKERRLQGSVDIPLNELGRQQAHQLAIFFEKTPVAGILSSDLSRARETAEIAASRAGVPVWLHPGLREANLGDAEGLHVDEVIAKYGTEFWAKWCSNELESESCRFPNGESKREALSRFMTSLEAHLDSTPFARIAVASHGFVLRRLIHHIRPELTDTFAVGNGIVYEFTFDVSSRVWTVELDPRHS